jgi:mannose-6-phosphate isomerase-like protein (cupin superfamily)
MSTAGVVVQPGQAKRVELHGSWMNYLVTGRDSKGCSLFEFDVAPGFDTGVHYHTRIEEFFYVLEGELDLRSGDQVAHAGPGMFLFVPQGTMHSIANLGKKRGRLLLGCLPPGHEDYFEELSAVLAKPGPPSSEAIAAMRKKYDTIQVSGLRSNSH